MLVPLFAAAALAASDAAPPPSGAPAAPGAAVSSDKPQPPSGPDKMICRHEDKIGSNVRIRVCRTRAEWDAEQQRVDQLMRDANGMGAVNTGAQLPSGTH